MANMSFSKIRSAADNKVPELSFSGTVNKDLNKQAKKYGLKKSVTLGDMRSQKMHFLHMHPYSKYICY